MKAEIWECRGGTFGYLFAFTIVLYLLIKHIFHFNLLVTYKGSIGDSRHDALNRKLRVKIKYNNCLVTCKQQWYNVKSLSGQKNIYGGLSVNGKQYRKEDVVL